MLAQVLLGCAAFLGFTRAVVRFHRHDIRFVTLLAWELLWLLVGVVAAVPDATNRLADLLGIGRGADVVLYGAIVVIVALLFRMSIRMEQLDRAITTVTREIALREHDQRKSHEAPLSNP